MSEDSGNAFGSGEGNSGYQTGGDSNGSNPAWGELLSSVPEEYHQAITPHLQKWDKGVQQRLERYSAWEPFVEQGFNPQDVEYGVGLINALNDNPKEVWDSIGQHYQFNQATGQPEQSQEVSEALSQLPPELQEKLNSLGDLETLVTTMAQIQMSERDKQLQEQQDRELEDELMQHTQAAGIDLQNNQQAEQIILGIIAGTDCSVEEAVNQYKEFVGQIRNPSPPPAPSLLSGGGAIPTSAPVNVKNMSPQQRRGLIADYLQTVNRSG